MDIWVGKHSVRRKGKEQLFFHSITHFMIIKSVEDPFGGRFLYNSAGHEVYFEEAVSLPCHWRGYFLR